MIVRKLYITYSSILNLCSNSKSKEKFGKVQESKNLNEQTDNSNLLSSIVLVKTSHANE